MPRISCELCDRVFDRGDMRHVVVELRTRDFDENAWRAAGYPLDSEPFFSDIHAIKSMTLCCGVHAARVLLDQPYV